MLSHKTVDCPPRVRTEAFSNMSVIIAERTRIPEGSTDVVQVKNTSRPLQRSTRRGETRAIPAVDRPLWH